MTHKENTIIIISLLSYFIACATPAMRLDRETWYGYEVLMIGWLAIFIGQFAWFANLIWIVGLLLFHFHKWFLSIIISSLAILLALHSLALIGETIPLDEGGVRTAILKFYDIGFYFWLGSMIIVDIGAIIMQIFSRKS